MYKLEDKRDGSKFFQLLKDAGYYVHKYKDELLTARNYFFLCLYLGYYGYAMSCNFKDDAAICLTVFTVFGMVYIIIQRLTKTEFWGRTWKALRKQFCQMYNYGRTPKIIRWFFIVAWSLGFFAYLIINVALKDANSLRSLAGMAVYLLLLVLLSNNRRRINWNCVFYGIILQCLFGLFVIRTTAGSTILVWFSDRIIEFMGYADVGSEFVFGAEFVNHRFAMQTMPAVIVFVAVIQVLMHLGVIQFVVRLIGTPVAYLLDVSAPEAMNACANILLGGAEAGAIIYEYLFTMPTSRLFAINVGGLSSVAGTALIQYIAFGVPVKYLLAASAMSAPAALVCAKIVYPDTDVKITDINMQEIELDVTTQTEIFDKDLTTKDQSPVKEKESGVLNEDETANIPVKTMKTDIKSDLFQPRSVGEALVLGTTNGMKLATSIIGILIVSLALLELTNSTVKWFGDRVNIDISLNLILSYLFYPFVYLMGVDAEDCLRAGEYLGLRTLSSPGVPYIYVGQLIRNRERLEEFTATFNLSIEYDRTKDILLPYWNETLVGGIFSERSELIITYALCGFASVPTVGVAFGLITAFVPHRLDELSKLAVKLLITGTIASYLTACVAGLLS
ncbi:solute carrier family 28 member 3-like [Ruditapes philippinarum]|uniref:solute carrier family 28 member 3-like n=1 Tax=Ruditapes philippinarum TaxID=129788 RepID=UPI00295B91FC|nr:solute carrier family 28 member 3-like [Ruditapes philippinarum]